jgi:hypothetical protein
MQQLVVNHKFPVAETQIRFAITRKSGWGELGSERVAFTPCRLVVPIIQGDQHAG